MAEQEQKIVDKNHLFSGNIFIFHAFDVGDDISLEKLRATATVTLRPLALPKYFKNYHIPLSIELPEPHESTQCIGVKIHSFGAISLTYKIPFKSTLYEVRKELESLVNQFQEQSVEDLGLLYRRIKRFINKPKFFHTRSSYVVIQVDPQPDKIDIAILKKEYGGIIASALRFETETLSEYQKNEMLDDAIGYFRGDLIVIDPAAAFVYDPMYEEILDFFEFVNIQQLELHYFDRTLDQQLNIIYEEKARKVPIKSYLPFIGSLSRGPIDDLGKLKVDISVITERLEGSIKLVGEPYFSELYELLVEKLGINEWKRTVDKKLDIIKEVRLVLQNKIDSIREDMLTMLIIILIFIELLVGVLGYTKI